MTSAIDWPGIRANAVFMGIRAAARAAAVNLPDDEQTRFVNRALQRAHREGWTDAKQVAQSSVVVGNEKPMSSTVITGAEAGQNMLDAEKNPKLLSLLEKREFLASAVRTPIGEIDEKSPLAHKIRRRRVTDKNGNVEETAEIESVAKLRALELDAKLAGELDSDKGADPGLVAITLVRVELPAAAARPVIDV